jgi:hypothetical protein
MNRFKEFIVLSDASAKAVNRAPARALITLIDESGIDEKADHGRQWFLGDCLRHPA